MWLYLQLQKYLCTFTISVLGEFINGSCSTVASSKGGLDLGKGLVKYEGQEERTLDFNDDQGTSEYMLIKYD